MFIGVGSNESVIFPGKSMKPELLKVSKATRRVQRTRQVRGKLSVLTCDSNLGGVRRFRGKNPNRLICQTVLFPNSQV